MTQRKYRFVREDDGSVVLVDFETMIGMDAAGGIVLQDGARARRDRSGEPHRQVFRAEPDTMSGERAETGTKPIPPSDRLGFTELQFDEFEADRKLHGFSGVEFVRDPYEPTFYQVKCNDRRTWERYVKHRGYADQNRTAGVAISPADLEAAKELVSRKN